MKRGLSVLFSTVVLGAVLLPLTWPAGEDSFPFSSYPMFSHGRTSSIADITHVVAIDASGQRTIVPPHEVASSAVIQTLVTIQDSVHAGPKAAKRFCREVAARLKHSNDATLRQATHVEIETTRVDSIAYLAGSTTTLGRTLHARCTP